MSRERGGCLSWFQLQIWAISFQNIADDLTRLGQKPGEFCTKDGKARCNKSPSDSRESLTCFACQSWSYSELDEIYVLIGRRSDLFFEKFC